MAWVWRLAMRRESQITVGATALVGFVQRARRSQVEFPTGFLFAAAGMIGAPIGSWLSRRIPDNVLLGTFSLLMVVISIRMWMQAGSHINEHSLHITGDDGPACSRDPEGKLRITSDCALLLAVVGMAAGILTGLFRVGVDSSLYLRSSSSAEWECSGPLARRFSSFRW
jgi:uncharacterized membrane protein YfcA